MNVDRYRKLRRLERDAGAAPGERDNARRLRERMEREHPNIRQAAAQANEREQTPVPGPYDTGTYGRRRPAEPPQERQGPGWGDRIRSFVENVAHEVGASFTISDMVRQDVDVEIRSNTRTLHVHVRIPLDALNRAADFSGGSLEEYSRLVGVYVGNHLSRLLRTRTHD